MKFIAIDTLGYDKLTEMAFDLNIKVRGRRDFKMTWVNAVRKELISRAVKGGKQVKPIARKAVRGCVSGLNFTIDALTSPKAKELYKNLGVLLSVLWAILWWVVTFLWDCADAALGKLVVDRCLELPATVPTPPADLKPMRPIVPAVQKVRRTAKQNWRSAVEMIDDVQSLVKPVMKRNSGGVAIAPITIA